MAGDVAIGLAQLTGAGDDALGSGAVNERGRGDDRSGNTLALLPETGPAPTEVQCAEAVAEGGAYTGKAAKGSRFCLTTNKGRTAYLSVLSAPDDRGIAKFKVTVWETPAA